MSSVAEDYIEELAKKTRLIKRRDVQRLTGLTRAQIRRLEEEGNFPARRKLGDRAVGWMLVEVVDWVKSLPAAKRDEVK